MCIIGTIKLSCVIAPAASTCVGPSATGAWSVVAFSLAGACLLVTLGSSAVRFRGVEAFSMAAWRLADCDFRVVGIEIRVVVSFRVVGTEIRVGVSARELEVCVVVIGC